jgi:hypothetical protein
VWFLRPMRLDFVSFLILTLFGVWPLYGGTPLPLPGYKVDGFMGFSMVHCR